jgi:hypothetical protein
MKKAMQSAAPRVDLPFYAATCHPPLLTRRQLLAAGGALLGAGAVGYSAAIAGDDGVSIIRRYAGLPDDPWAVCHGVRGMGRDFKLKDGRRAVEWLLESHLVSVPVPGGTALAFPLAVEVHPNMFLKTMLEAGVPLDHPFVHQGRRRTLREVAEGARALFRPAEVIRQPNMLPWSIIALANTTPAPHGRWTNAWGEPVDLDLVVESALRLMEEASAPLMQSMRQDRPESAKAPVQSFTCGGTHMLYSLLTAAHTGYAGRDRLERVRQQADLMLWRLHGDLGLIDRFYKERAAQPGAYWYEVDAKVKLLGHGQECLAFGMSRGVLKFGGGQEAERRAAMTTLRRMIEDMEGRNLAEPRELDRELFRQIVGDTCHARRGLTLV